MGQQLYIGTDLRIASNITFIPGAEANRHHALATAICNRGKTDDGRELRDEITLNFWAKRAVNAAHYLYPGKQVNIYGRIQSYTQDTGQHTAAGKKVLNRRVEVVVTRMELLGDSMKMIEQIVAGNIALLKNAGRLPAEVVITAAELLKSNKPKPVDFNPAAVVAAGGKFGLARVWSKEHNFWDEKSGIVTTPAAPMTGTPVDTAAALTMIEDLKKQIAAAALPADIPVESPVEMSSGAESIADPFPVG